MNEADQDPTDEREDPHPRKSRSTLALVSTFLTVASVIITIDVVTKVAAVHWLTDAPPKAILEGVLYFNLTRNPGAAFSMLVDYTWVLSLIAAVVVLVLLALSLKIRNLPWSITLGLVLGGAAGNLVDRIFREPGFMQGHVVDFVSVFDPAGRAFPIFNVADSSLVIGVIFVILLEFSGRTFTVPVEEKSDTDSETEPTASAEDSPPESAESSDLDPSDHPTDSESGESRT